MTNAEMRENGSQESHEPDEEPPPGLYDSPAIQV